MLRELEQDKDAANNALHRTLQEKDAEMQQLKAEVAKMKQKMEQLKASSGASAEEAVREERMEAEERSRETALDTPSGQTDLPPFLPPLHRLSIGRGRGHVPCHNLAPTWYVPSSQRRR